MYSNSRHLKRFIWPLVVLTLFLVFVNFAFLSYKTNKNISHLAELDKFDQQNFNMAIYSSLVTKFSEFLNWNWQPNQSVVKIYGDGDSLFNEDIKLKGENFSWSKGRIFIENEQYKVRLKNKGESPFHKIQYDRSFAVKSKKKSLVFNKQRRFSLDKISHPAVVADQISYEVALSLGLLIPEHKLILTSINDRPAQLRQFVASIDEQILRLSKRMPADIYSLKTTGKRRDTGMEGRFINGFYSPNSWVKKSYNNHFDRDSNAPLRKLLLLFSQIKSGNDKAKSEFLSMIDIKKFSNFILYNHIIQSAHQDNAHNTSLYYDPWSQKFEPIVEDQMAWHGIFGSTFTQRIPKTVKIQEFTKAFSLNNDLLDYLKKMPMVQKQIQLSWKEKREDIYKIQEKYPDYQRFIERNLPLVGPFVLGSRITNQNETLEAYRVLKLYIDESLKSTDSLYFLPESGKASVNNIQPSFKFDGVNIIEKNLDLSAYNVDVAQGTVFKLAKGVHIKFSNAIFRGSENKPIYVEQLTQGESFGGLFFKDAQNISIQNLIVSGGSGYKSNFFEYTGQMSFHNVDNLTVKNSKFSSNQIFDDNVHLVYVNNFLFDNVEISNSLADGLDIDISTGKINNSKFENNGNDGIDLMSSEVKVNNIIAKKNGDKGISVGELSRLTIENSSLVDNNIGIEIKDASRVILGSSNSMTSNQVADINLKRKNWRFGSGGILEQSDTGNDNYTIIKDKHSKIRGFK